MAGRLQRGLGGHAVPGVRSASSIHVVGVLVYDLLIVGGRVVDPSQGLDRRSDIAIRDGYPKKEGGCASNAIVSCRALAKCCN